MCILSDFLCHLELVERSFDRSVICTDYTAKTYFLQDVMTIRLTLELVCDIMSASTATQKHGRMMVVLYRNIGECREYLARRMPAQTPRWLMDRMAELLFRNPEWRLAEVADLVPGQPINFVIMDILRNMEPSINFATTATFDPELTREGEHGMYAKWHNDHEAIQCFGPIIDVLLLGDRMPDPCGEPHRIPMVKKAEPIRHLLDQMEELRTVVT